MPLRSFSAERGDWLFRIGQTGDVDALRAAADVAGRLALSHELDGEWADTAAQWRKQYNCYELLARCGPEAELVSAAMQTALRRQLQALSRLEWYGVFLETLRLLAEGGDPKAATLLRLLEKYIV